MEMEAASSHSKDKIQVQGDQQRSQVFLEHKAQFEGGCEGSCMITGRQCQVMTARIQLCCRHVEEGGLIADEGRVEDELEEVVDARAASAEESMRA